MLRVFARRVGVGAAWGLGLIGLGLRLRDFGRYGLWNDEAWVALSTRVEGWEQFWLSIAVTPIAWAGLLRPLALLPVPPEVGLRILPLAASAAAMALAWWLGRALAGHTLGGLLALALLAVDPASIRHAQLLKPYGTESALALATLGVLYLVARTVDARSLLGLVVLLTLGTSLASSQLLLAPPVLLALWLGGARAGRRRLAIATGVVAVWGAAYFVVALRPRMTPVLLEYWRGSYVPTETVGAGLRFVWHGLSRLLTPSLGADAVPLTLVGVSAAWLAGGAARAVALAVALLVAEVAALSALETIPFGEQRTMLFLSSALVVVAAGGVVVALRAAWRWRGLRPVVVAAGAWWLLGLASAHDWGSLGRLARPEDLGPLIRQVEAARRPGDRVLLYERSGYVWAYYQRRIPRIVPTPRTTVGWVPIIDDPALVLAGREDAEAAVARAVRGAERVWFLGSRFRGRDDAHIVAMLAAHGEVLHDERRARARLVLVRPSAAARRQPAR